MNSRTEQRPYRELDDDERYYATAPIGEIRRELEHYGVEPVTDAVRTLIEERTPRPRAEKTYLQHLELIERIAAHVAGRSHLTADETAEFVQVARVRLFENDYAIVREFEGRSSFSTYVTTVILRLFHQWRIELWGKWRSESSAEERVWAGEREIALRAAAAGLDRAIDDFSEEDRLILQLRFWNGKTAPEIARILGLEPRKIYTRLDRLFKELRQALEDAGIDQAAIDELLDGPALDLSLEPRPEASGRKKAGSNGR